MSLKTLETVTDQARSTVRTIAGNAAASAKRETSITGWANRLLAGGVKKKPSVRKNWDEGVYILSAEDARRGRRMDGGSFVAPDGYVRRSPVQEIVVDPGCRHRLVQRAVLCAAGIVVLVATLAALMHLGVIGF